MKMRNHPTTGEPMPQLGLGCMRFPRKGKSVDIRAATGLVELAVSKGVTYFDAAYIYPGIERALGTILCQTGLRNKVKIATKLPLFLCKTRDDIDRIFEKQLQRLQVDCIDYYLLHMLSDTVAWSRMQALGIEEWVTTQKAKGRIAHFGFSYHGGRDQFIQLMDAYDWDFCMIQYNYLDEWNQAGRHGLQYAHQKGVPVFVMEPLRGGSLVRDLPDEAKELYRQQNPDRSLADWALRWLLDQPEVSMVLSGMNSAQQIEENIRLAEQLTAGCVGPQERDVYHRVIKVLQKSAQIPCTACGYCMPCPVGVDIPTCFSCYNEIGVTNFITALRHYFMNTGCMTAKPSYASKCIQCGKCEAHCPQHIEIRKQLKRTARKLEPVWLRPIRFTLQKIANRNGNG